MSLWSAGNPRTPLPEVEDRDERTVVRHAIRDRLDSEQGYAISETGSPFLKINNLGEVEDCLWIAGQDAVFGYRLRDDNHA